MKIIKLALMAGAIVIFAYFSAEAQTDTLKTYFERSSGFHVYTYSNGSHPLTGSNNMYSMLGVKFLFSGEARLAGVLVAFAEKKTGGDFKHQIIVYHLDEQGNMPAGKAVGVGEFYMNQITANKDNPVFTYLPINVAPAYVKKSFGVMLHTRAALQNDDYISIFSNAQGDGQGMRSSFDVWADQNGNPQYENLYDFPQSTNIGDKPDIDVMIIPVMDYSESVPDSPEFNGIQIVSAGPNPVRDDFTLKLKSQTSGPITVAIIDINGKTLDKKESESDTGAEQTFQFNAGSYSAGSYFYYVQSGAVKFSGMFVKSE